MTRHIRPRTQSVANWGKDYQFRCQGCKRELPESRFILIHHSRQALYYSRHCRTCLNLRKTKLSGHPMYSEHLHLFIRQTVEQSINGARKREIAWCLTEEDVLSLYFQQKGLCALSGQKMSTRIIRRGRPPRTQTSIDRINNTGSYTLDNVQLVCAVVNVMKNDMGMDEFLRWCMRVSVHAMGALDGGA